MVLSPPSSCAKNKRYHGEQNPHTVSLRYFQELYNGVTRGPHKERQNLGIYRQQLIGKNKLIMRWLSHRGGALDYQEWCAAHPGERFPVSVALGADPATILGAVTPVPDTLSEYAFAGLLRGTKTEVVKCISNDLEVPASAEIVLEGYIEQGETAPEGPYGDHTGYYNEVDSFPVFTVTHITQRCIIQRLLNFCLNLQYPKEK